MAHTNISISSIQLGRIAVPGMKVVRALQKELVLASLTKLADVLPLDFSQNMSKAQQRSNDDKRKPSSKAVMPQRMCPMTTASKIMTEA